MLVVGGTLEIIRSKHWLVPRSVWLQPLESRFNRTGNPHTQILIQKIDTGGLVLLCVQKASRGDPCAQPNPLLTQNTLLLQVTPRKTSMCCRSLLAAELGGKLRLFGHSTHVLFVCIMLPPSSSLKAPLTTRSIVRMRNLLAGQTMDKLDVCKQEASSACLLDNLLAV